jgi:hypothetical protein
MPSEATLFIEVRSDDIAFGMKKDAYATPLSL